MVVNLRDRKALLADRLRAGLRHRPDVDARDVPVGRVVHRRAVRSRLHDRRRRAGQGARPADRGRPADARRRPPMVEDMRAAQADRRAPGRPPRSRSSTRSSRQLKAAQAELKAPREARRSGRSRSSRRRLREARSRTRRTSPSAIARRPPRSASSRRRSTTWSPQQYQLGQHPVAVQRDAVWPMPGSSRRSSAAPASSASRRSASCAHFHNGIDIVGPAAARRSRPPGRGRIGYIGWNYADGADPAWIVIIAHSTEPRRRGMPT